MSVTIEGIGIFLGLVIAVSTVASIIVRIALVPYLEKVLIAPVKNELAVIRKQVENSHTTNLRDDITKIIDHFGIDG